MFGKNDTLNFGLICKEEKHPRHLIWRNKYFFINMLSINCYPIHETWEKRALRYCLIMIDEQNVSPYFDYNILKVQTTTGNPYIMLGDSFKMLSPKTKPEFIQMFLTLV